MIAGLWPSSKLPVNQIADRFGRRYYMGVRSCISILMVLALKFLQAPFLHLHQHESTENHPHRFFHNHFPHASSTRRLRAGDKLRLSAYSTTSSFLLAQSSTPMARELYKRPYAVFFR